MLLTNATKGFSMGTYCVTFYKYVTDSSGHEFKCSQATVMVRAARSVERALKAAERRFERVKGVGDWTLMADLSELTPSGTKAPIHTERADHSACSPPTLLRRVPRT